MKLTSILSKIPLALITILMLSCNSETIDDLNLEENETTLTISQLNSVKNYKLLHKFKTCFSIIIDEEITETIIDEETGEIIETVSEEISTEETTEDYTEITFPVTIILDNETAEITITNLEELMTVIETCNTKKQDCDKGKLCASEINAKILKGFKRCFEVVTDQETCSEKKRNSKNRRSNRKYSVRDLTFPITVIFDNETIEIIDLDALKELVKICRQRGCDDDEVCSLTVELKTEYDGEGTTIYVETEEENLSYTWSTGATEASIYVFPVGTTTYTVTITDENDCTITESITIEFNEKQIPIITRA